MLFNTRPFRGLSYAASILADGAVGYWRLGESSGTVLVDELGTHNGTYISSPTLGSASLIANDSNTSVLFTSTQKGNISNTTTIDLTSNFTLECWVKTTDTTLNTLIFGSYYAATNVGHGIGLYLDNVFMAFDGVSSLIVSRPAVFNGNPHHLVATYAGASPNITGTLYVDGVSIGSTVNRSVSHSDALGVASYSQAAGAMNGNMDECAIYNTVLSLATIQAHYELGT